MLEESKIVSDEDKKHINPYNFKLWGAIALAAIILAAGGYFAYTKYGEKTELKSQTNSEGSLANNSGNDEGVSADNQISIEELKNATYGNIQTAADPSKLVIRSFTLKNGMATIAPATEYNLVSDQIIFGDLDGDNYDDAAVIVTERDTTANGTFYNLCVFRNNSGAPQYLTGIMLEDRIKVSQFVIKLGTISITYSVWQNGEYQNETIHNYRLVNGRLTKDSTSSTDPNIASQKTTFEKNAAGEYYGEVYLAGHISFVERNELAFEENSPKIQYAMLNVTESNNPNLALFIKSMSGNSYVIENGIGLGCYKENKLYSDTIGGSNEITGSGLQKILSSTKNQPVKMRLTKANIDGGAGAGTCFSHFKIEKVY